MRRCRATAGWSAPATSGARDRACTRWLPLGYRVFRKVEQIVREEMDAIGAQEVHFPALLPKEPYEATGRWSDYGDGIFRLKDRKGADYLLGPTHEEMFALLVKDLYSSYKDLPLALYQIQTKYRDEAAAASRAAARPRVRDEGLLFLRHRRRWAAEVLRRSPRRLHQDLRPARLRVRDRARHVRGDGRLGQRGVPRRGRERRGHLRPLAGGYAANVEAVRITPPAPLAVRRCAGRPRGGHSGHAHDRDAGRPGQRPVPAARPALAGRGHAEERGADGRGAWTARGTRWSIGVPGDREVDLKRLAAQLEPAEAEPFSEADFAAYPGLVKGYIGPADARASAVGAAGSATWSTRGWSRAPGG